MALLGGEGREGTADSEKVAVVQTAHPEHNRRPGSWSLGIVEGRGDKGEAGKLRQITGLYMPGPGTESSLR